MTLPADTPPFAPKSTKTVTVLKGKKQTEDPRKVAAREVFLAHQRLIDAEDAMAVAKAGLAEKTKAFDAVRNTGKRA